MNKHRDFTQFITERQKNAPSFTMFGETYHLSPSLSYEAVLKFQSLSKRNESDEMSYAELFGIFEEVIGKKNVQELKVHSEFDIDTMIELINWAFEVYGITKKDDGVQRPNPKGRKQQLP